MSRLWLKPANFSRIDPWWSHTMERKITTCTYAVVLIMHCHHVARVPLYKLWHFSVFALHFFYKLVDPIVNLQYTDIQYNPNYSALCSTSTIEYTLSLWMYSIINFCGWEFLWQQSQAQKLAKHKIYPPHIWVCIVHYIGT